MTKADLELQREEKKMEEMREKIKEQQRKIAKAKKKKEKEIAEDQQKIGQAITTCFPELLNLMHEDGFNIFEFVKSNEFQQAFYLTYVVGRPQNSPGWVRGEWESPDEDYEEDIQDDESERSELEKDLSSAYFI